jgi:hypothetical protein
MKETITKYKLELIVRRASFDYGMLAEWKFIQTLNEEYDLPTLENILNGIRDGINPKRLSGLEIDDMKSIIISNIRNRKLQELGI